MFSDLKGLNDVVGDNVLLLVFLVAISWFIITKVAESKEAVAKLLGPWGRRIRANKEKRQELHREEVRKEAKRVLKEAGGLEPPDYQAVKIQLGNVKEELQGQQATITQIQLENRGLRTYILQDEDWHWDDERAAIREDRTVRARVNFDEFIADFMMRNSPRRERINGT